MEYSPFATALVIFAATYLIWIEIVAAGIFFLVSDKGLRKKLLKGVLFVIPLSYCIAILLSQIFENPRPFIIDGFDPLASNATDNGFPSDHTLFASAIAGVFLVHKKQIGLWFTIVALIVGVGRVYAGVHHSIDIVGALAITSIVTLLYLSLSRRN